MDVLNSTNCSFYFLRLKPGDDLRQALNTFCAANTITAGSILSGVGSFKKTKLRKANSDDFYTSDEPHEILTISGLISMDGVHIHISVSDKNAQVFGGHLSDGNIVYTTVELIVASFPLVHFAREFDSTTGFKELLIRTYTR